MWKARRAFVFALALILFLTGSSTLFVPAAGPVTLAFAGDVNLADNWENMQAFPGRPGGVPKAFNGGLLERMRAADVLFVNNEFTLSDRGEAAPKTYTFRAATKNVGLYREMGVDIVSVANNHVFDYGPGAFLDTLDTLTAAGIPCAGAGRNLNDAMRARYFLAGGMKLAYIAAAHTESYMYSFPATAEKPGLLPCYEGDALLRAVKDARKRADFVIVYLHWGIEYEPMPEKRQVELAHSLIDSGADAVLGTHPHVLQGIEFYKDKPIAYSLGNFWFNVGWVDSALLEIELTAPGDCILRVLPCATEGGTARLMSEQERARIFRHLESISSNIRITEGGVVEGPAK